MKIKIYGSTLEMELITFPDKCPHCHTSINPVPIYSYPKIINSNTELQALMACPVAACKESFIAYFSFAATNTYRYSKKTSIGTLLARSFSDIINEISNSFVTIFNQAYSAEQYNLLEICGVGYRKSLEFLIKDYALLRFPEKKEVIEKVALAQCISDYISSTNIKSVAKRAVWLGNDETHYVKKWDNKDLGDLKKLIDLTLHWIEMEELTASIEKDMPG